MVFILWERDSFSSLRDDVSSWRSLIRYFWPSDLMLRRKIPVMKKNWMKLSFLFIAFANSPRLGFLGFCWTRSEEEDEAEAILLPLSVTAGPKCFYEVVTQCSPKHFIRVWVLRVQYGSPGPLMDPE